MARRYWIADTGLGPRRVRLTRPLDPRRFQPYHLAPVDGLLPCPRALPAISVDDNLNHAPGSALALVVDHLLGNVLSPDMSAECPPESATLSTIPSRCADTTPPRPQSAGEFNGAVAQTASVNFKTIRLGEDQVLLSSDVTGSKPQALYLLEAGSDLPTGFATSANRWDLRFGKILGRGRLGSAYRATLQPEGEKDMSISLVAKLMVLAPEGHLHNGKPRSDAYPDARSALNAAWDEAEIYGRLAPAQKDLVPYYYGLLSTKEEDHTHLIALMSDAGGAIEKVATSVDEYDRFGTLVREAYTRLHREFLVLHVDTGARHMRLLRGEAGERIQLIDFEASMAFVEDDGSDDDIAGWEVVVENEMNEVEVLLSDGRRKVLARK